MRYPLAVCSWLGGFACSGNTQLAGTLASDFLTGDLKDAFRRAGWLAKHSWLKTSLVSDPFYLFTDKMDQSRLAIYKQWLEARKPALSRAVYGSNRLMVLAQQIHLLLEANSPHSYANLEEHPATAAIEEFEALKKELLSLAPVTGKAGQQGKDKERTGDFSLEDARQALVDLAALLPITEYPWYLISGTFLGLHRDGGFMAHDYDIDVGMHAEQVSLEPMLQKLRQQNLLALKKVDYHLQVIQTDTGYTLEQKPALIKLVHANGINVDIFIHHLEDGIRWHGSSIHRWDNTEFDLEEATLEGVSVLQPVQADRYLTENYGDWRTPVTDFNCSTGTPNLTISHNFLSHALFVTVYLYEGAGQLCVDRRIKNQLESSCPVKKED